MRLKTVTKILIAVFIIGLSLLLYPSFSNYWNRKHATQAISNYSENIGSVSDDRYEELWNDAVLYNERLAHRTDPFAAPDELKEIYESMLDINGTGVMGYIEIPKLDVSLPMYHGTSAAVLQIAAGHLDWTSLPVGGASSHCALSGHRGLPSAKLFTDLNKLREGDTFTLVVLNEFLTYEIDRIRTVLPNDSTDLMIQEGEDLCTLVTCTPYGINTHRLLVRGHRIATQQKGAVVISEAVLVDQLIVAFYLGFPLIIILFLMVMLKKPPKKITIDPITLKVSENGKKRGNKK